MKKLLFIITVTLLFFVRSFGQSYTIRGKVTDAETGDPIPFANVVITGTTKSAVTAFDGKYSLTSTTKPDSISVVYIGYRTRTKPVDKKKISASGSQIIDFQLSPEGINLKEVTVYAGENPAYGIIRIAKKRKDDNSYRKLESYELSAYTRMEVDMDNLGEKFRKRNLLGSMVAALDSIKTLKLIVGDEGQPLIPMFLSETKSKVYFQRSPERKKEVIEKTKVVGVGVDNGEFISQMIGNSLQDFDFHTNWVKMYGKFFVSPIADSWKLYYEYYLIDSSLINGEKTYRIDFEPKREADLAFSGSIWINSVDYAISQIDVRLGREANLNFIDKVLIKQSLVRTEQGAWFPEQTRITIDFAEVASNLTTGFLVKHYTKNEIDAVNLALPNKIFDGNTVSRAEDAFIHTDAYWEQVRPDSGTEVKKFYAMIDTIMKVEKVKRWTSISRFLIDGYARNKNFPFEFGPYIYSYAFNDIEGHRFRASIKSSYFWSNKFQLYGYAAYGTLDRRFKYRVHPYYILSRKNWTEVGFKYKSDINLLAVRDVEEPYNAVLEGQPFFAAFVRFGKITRNAPYWEDKFELYGVREIIKGWRVGATYRRFNFNPLYDFEYQTNPGGSDNSVFSEFGTSEAEVFVRWAKREAVVQRQNTRMGLGGNEWPIIALIYTRGFGESFGGNIPFNKLTLDASHYVRMGTFGRGYFEVNAQIIPDVVPYPLLTTHLGNESPINNYWSYNMMNFFEFISDKYFSVKYKHEFQGLISNNIPVFEKLHWRFFTTTDVIIGEISPENRRRIDASPHQNLSFYSLNDQPYLQVGYGVENIFDVFRIDFMHRLTHLDKPNTVPFAIKASFKISL